MLNTIEDQYGGIIVEDSALIPTKDIFANEITQLIKSLINKKLLWVKIPIDKSEYIPILTNLNFEFHHCD